jgi:hypothetical protein
MKALEKQRDSARFQANEKENDVGRRAVVAAVVEFRDRIIAPLRVAVAVTAQQCDLIWHTRCDCTSVCELTAAPCVQLGCPRVSKDP